MKTTAIVEYRDHVLSGWFAVEFCDVKFLGPNAEDLDDKWQKIIYRKYDEKKEKISSLDNCRNNLIEQVRKFRASINKPWYRLWYNSEEKEIIAKICILEKEINEYESEIEELKEDRFYSASEKVQMAEKFLTNCGFVLHASSSSGDCCTTHKDIWYYDNP